MATLTTTLEDMMTPRVLGRLASDSGLSEAKVRTGLSGAIASIVDGLATKADDSRTMGRVADLASRGPDVDLQRPEQLLDEGSQARRTGNELLFLSTPDSSGLVSRLASMLGVGGKAAASLVGGAASLAFAAFRKLGRARGGIGADELSSLLHRERDQIHAAVPAGLATPAVFERRQRDVAVRRPVRSGAWLGLLILLAVVLAALWWFSRERTQRVGRVEEPSTAPLVHETTATEEPVMPERAVVQDAATPGAATEQP